MTDANRSAGSDEIDLAALDDDELVKQMHDDLYDGLADEIVEGTMILLDRGWSPDRTLNDALVEGMRIVGIDFRDGILFVPEVLLAANAMKAGMEILRPLLAETGAESIGKIVIGTVKGDIHDIGKNLVAMMLEGAGFEVVDLGINTDVDKFLAALELHKPDILGMSALLTTTMPYMKVVIDTLAEKGLRDTYIVLVGGAPLNEEFGAAIGADAVLPRRGGRGRDRQVARERPSQDARRTARTVGGVIVAADRAETATAARRGPLVTTPLVIGCGALASELRAVLVAGGVADAVEVRYLPAHLHNRPERIVPAVEEALAGETGREVLIAYADCGTGGALDRFVAGRPNTTRLPGAHCYELFAGPRRVRRAARRRAGHVLPDRLPGPALRCARVAGARSRPAPRAARRVLRQLPASRAAVAVRGSSRRRGRPGRR